MNFWSVVFRIALALLIGMVIGVERESKHRPAGMRTNTLVCLGACVVALIEFEFFSRVQAASVNNLTYNFGRMAAQVISGIGFLGAGTILFSERKVTGLTTAASLWNVACIGLAIGYGYYRIALIAAALVLLVLYAMGRVIHVRTLSELEIRFINREETMSFMKGYFNREGISAVSINFSAKRVDGQIVYTNVYSLHIPKSVSLVDVVNALTDYESILAVKTTSI